MLEHMKKPHVELLHVTCTQDAYAEVLKALEGIDCRVERSIPVEDCLDQTPGAMLRAARYREDLTQVQLEAKTGIARRHISDMEHNRRPIGKANARKLAGALRVDYRVFL